MKDFSEELYHRDSQIGSDYDYAEQKPFSVLYNDKAKAWIIHGNIKPGFDYTMCIVISSNDGKILLGCYI